MLKEKLGALGILGDKAEPLLNLALERITGKKIARIMKKSPIKDFEFFKDSKSMNRFQNEMYIDKAPEGLLKALEQQ